MSRQSRPSVAASLRARELNAVSTAGWYCAACLVACGASALNGGVRYRMDSACAICKMPTQCLWKRVSNLAMEIRQAVLEADEQPTQ